MKYSNFYANVLQEVGMHITEDFEKQGVNTGYCDYCGEFEQLTEVDGLYVCNSCLNDLGKQKRNIGERHLQHMIEEGVARIL